MTIILMGVGRRDDKKIKKTTNVPTPPLVTLCASHPDQAIVVDGAEKDLQKQGPVLWNKLNML